MTEPTALTFEHGYRRLQAIADRVTSEDVPVAEMCDLFAEGKGLQTALTVYLDEQKSRVEQIERGEGIQAFRIVAPAEDAVGPPDVPPTLAAAPSVPRLDEEVPF